MANLDTLLAVGEKSQKIAELEAQVEALRFERAADMVKARKEGATLEKIGDAASMTHAAVRKAITELGPGSAKAKDRKRVAANVARRQRYEASKPKTEEERELARAGYRANYHSQKAGQSIRQG
jgi:hypothetical protein